MNKRQAKRLLNVARALRESPHPEVFDMGNFVNNPADLEFRDIEPEPNLCGTPACALGHYAARTDLQRLMRIAKLNETDWLGRPQFGLRYGNNRGVAFADATVCNHFGINNNEAHDLFGGWGCGAENTEEAAQYIESFVHQTYGAVA